LILSPLTPPPPTSTLFPYTTLFRSQLRAFYTLSRSIDPSTGGSGQDLNAVSNPYVGWRYDLGPSIFDRTHNFSANFIYSIPVLRDRKSTRLNSSHVEISYAVFCLKK